MSDQGPLDEEGDQRAARRGQSTGEVQDDEDLGSEVKREQTAGREEEGPLEKVKEKGQELLDKVSGPDVPPSPTDERRRN